MAETALDSGPVVKPPTTVREELDEALVNARQRVENICIAKAKAETLGLLDAPMDVLRSILHPGFPF